MADLRVEFGQIISGTPHLFDERKAALQADPNCTITHEDNACPNQWVIVYHYTET